MHANITAFANATTWAILPSSLASSLDAARRGEVSRRVKLPRVHGQVALLPIHGTITQRGSDWDEIFGGTATQGFEAAFQRAVDSDRIKAIVLDVDSPGGTTAGVEQAADRVFRARGSKPIVAVANSQAASAAYWIASSADSFVASPGADVGSIGVFRMHQDVSKAMDDMGVATTFIAEPEHKVEGNPFQPLSEDAVAHHKEQVHDTYLAFNGAVARNRGVTTAVARETFGKGRTFNAGEAAKRGMVDRVASMAQVMSELGVQPSGGQAEAAAADELTQWLCEAWTGDPVDRQPFPKQLARARLRFREIA